MTLIFAAPALPLHAAGKYVAGAYIVFIALILIYVSIMAVRQGRSRQELLKLRDEIRAKELDRELGADLEYGNGETSFVWRDQPSGDRPGGDPPERDHETS